MGALRRIGIAGGLACLAIGCSKPSAPVAQLEPIPTPVETVPTVPTKAETRPSTDGPEIVEPPKIEGPSSTIRPKLPAPLVPVLQEPKPVEPPKPVEAPKPVVPKPAEPPKPVDPPKPTDPPKTEVPPVKPKEVKYPEFVDGKDLMTWIKQLNAATQPDPQLREFALKTLPQFGPEARKPSIGPITELIYKDPDPGVRIIAITIISNMGYDIRDQIKPAVSALRTCINATSNGSIVRLFCVRSLMSFGPEALLAVPEIKLAGNDPSWETRLAVAKALGQIGAPASENQEPNDAAAKFLLNTMLKDTCGAVRLEAIHALLQVGPPKPKTPDAYIKDIKLYLEPVEIRVKKENDKGILCWLYLLNIMYDDRVLKDKDKDYLKKIASYIKAPDAPMVRLHAINACSALGPRAAPVIPEIMDALNYDEPELVIAAMSALAQIGKDARGAAGVLEKIKAGSKDPVKPPDAPKDWKPDLTLRFVAEDALLYVTGKKTINDLDPKKDK